MIYHVSGLLKITTTITDHGLKITTTITDHSLKIITTITDHTANSAKDLEVYSLIDRLYIEQTFTL